MIQLEVLLFVSVCPNWVLRLSSSCTTSSSWLFKSGMVSSCSGKLFSPGVDPASCSLFVRLTEYMRAS